MPLVKGFLFTLILNFDKEEFYSIPNSILTDLEVNINSGNAAPKYIKNYISKLESTGFILSVPKTMKSSFYRPIKIDQQPNHISNLLIEYNVAHDYHTVLKALNRSHILIVVRSIIDFDALLDYISIYSANYYYLHLEVSYKTSKWLIKYLNSHFIPQIIEVHFYGRNEPTNVIDVVATFWHSGKIPDLKREVAGHLDLFECNNLFFNEALHFHSYFNKKLYISNDGTLSNTVFVQKPKMQLSAISNTSDFYKFISSNAFKRLWSVKKDSTNVCQDCEFRYNCTDNRVPLEKEYLSGEWYHESECDYNPYIGKWRGEEGYVPLAKIGTINQFEFFPDENKIMTHISQFH